MNWSDYKDHNITTSNSKNTEEVLDPNFVPINGATMDLFTGKQKYVFQVFVTNLKTDKGKELVKQYKVDFDVQSVWRDLLVHMNTSTSAKTSTRKIFRYIINIHQLQLYMKYLAGVYNVQGHSWPYISSDPNSLCLIVSLFYGPLLGRRVGKVVSDSVSDPDPSGLFREGSS